MDITAFWNLINKTLAESAGDPFKQAELLTEALAQLHENNILIYDSILWELMNNSYIVDLWEAAYIIGCGCGDDGFMDFRAWLIGRGKDVFEKALIDPESLLDIVETGWETQEGNLLYVAPHAYEIKTGKDIPPISVESPKLKGKPSGDEKAVLARFPKLTEKFWKKCGQEFYK